MATTTDCDVCSTPRLISVDDDVTTASLDGSEDDAVVGVVGTMPEAS